MDKFRQNEDDSNRTKKLEELREKVGAAADITPLTDSTGGVTDETLEAVPSDSLVNVAAAANNNFAELSAKIDELIASLA